MYININKALVKGNAYILKCFTQCKIFELVSLFGFFIDFCVIDEYVCKEMGLTFPSKILFSTLKRYWKTHFKLERAVA